MSDKIVLKYRKPTQYSGSYSEMMKQIVQNALYTLNSNLDCPAPPQLNFIEAEKILTARGSIQLEK